MNVLITSRHIGASLLAAVVFVTAAGYQAEFTQADTKPACITNYNIYPGIDSVFPNSDSYNRVEQLQAILQYEGYVISSDERSSTRPSYSISTAAAVVKSQQDHLTLIRTLSGNTTYLPTGYVDGVYQKYLENKYGCTEGTFTTVTYPNGGETLEVGDKPKIKWTTDSQIKKSEKVSLYLIDESVTPSKRELIKTVKNTGSYAWKVPSKLGSIDLSAAKSNYRIEVVPAKSDTLGAGAIDKSDAQFSIGYGSNATGAFSIIGPTGGSLIAGTATTTKIIAGTIPGASGATVRLVKSSGSSKTNLVSSTNVTNLAKGVLVTIPDATAAGTYKIEIEIRTSAGATLTAESASFEVVAKSTSIEMTSPRGVILQGAATTTNWTYKNVPSTTPITIKLVNDAGSVVSNLVTSGKVSSKKATIKIPSSADVGDYTLLLEAAVKNGPTVTATSPEFSITSLEFAAQIQNVSLSVSTATTGSSMSVTWTHPNIVASTPVVIKLVDSHNREVANLVTTGTVAAKKANITIPTFVSAGTYKIQVTANVKNGTPISGYSSELVISEPAAESVSVTDPDGGTYEQGASVTTKWTYNSILASTPVTVKLVDTSGNIVANLVSSGLTASKKTATFKIPTTVAGGTYKIRVDANVRGGGTISGTSKTITITAPDLTPVLSSLSLSVSAVETGKTAVITWASSNIANNVPVVVKLVTTGGTEVANLVSSGITVASKKATFTIPTSVAAGTYRVKVTANIPKSSSVSASSGDLTVALPVASISITDPIGTTVLAGKNTTAKWTFSNIVTSTPLVITLVKADDLSHVANLISSGLTINAKTRAVTIPTFASDGDYKLKLVANVKNGSSVTGYSPTFTVDGN